jgi:hypothetical protein
MVSMIRGSEVKEIPEYDVEDAMCSGWVKIDDTTETVGVAEIGDLPKKRGRPAKS